MPPPPPPPAAQRSMQNRSQAPSYGGCGFPEQQYSAPRLQGGAMQGVELQYSLSRTQDPFKPQAMQRPAPQQQYALYEQDFMMQPTPPYSPSTVQGGMAPPQYINLRPGQVAFQQRLLQSRPVRVHPDPQNPASPPMSEQQYLQDSLPTDSAANTLGDEKKQYLKQLRMTFEAIRTGKVNQASETLMQISNWLLSSVVALGLHIDKSEEHATRVELWKEFNLCWEALGWKQKHITEEAIRTGRQPADILTAERLRTMVEDLVKLCDAIAPHGLVDYDMGVWEEQIVDIFEKCLELFPSTQSATQND